MKTWQKLRQKPHLFKRYFVKEYVIQACREFFLKKKYHEFESPILASALPQEAYCDPLETKIRIASGKEKSVYLIPTTETYNKKILAAGLGNHFVISKVFRNLEEAGLNHSVEFTMLEWYSLDSTYMDLMDDCEDLILFIKKSLDQKFNRNFTNELIYQEQKISLNRKWDRLSVVNALKNYANINIQKIQKIQEFKKIMRDKGYKIEKEDNWQVLFELVFASEIEPRFPKNKPIFVYDYPIQICPLTKTKKDNPLVCEKVELYIAGKEIANGYSELDDAKEQEKRFKSQQKIRRGLGRKPVKFDFELIDALKTGLPKVAGIGMGLDRLAMILANVETVSKINYFPSEEMFD